MIETGEERKTEPMSKESKIEPEMKQKSEDFDSILLEQELMNKNQIKTSKLIHGLISQYDTVTIESNDVIQVNRENWALKLRHVCTIYSNQLKKN